MPPLHVKFTKSALKYFENLDKPTRARIAEKLTAIAANPFDPRLSKPLQQTTQRSARVGDYRILFEVDEVNLYVADIGPRGQIYRRVKRS